MTTDETPASGTPIGRRGALAAFVVAAAGVTGAWSYDRIVRSDGSSEGPSEPTHYVNADGGDDDADGRSPETAWETLERVNERSFEPGDVLGLRAGTEYDGRLDPDGSGTDGEPIYVTAYGDGPRPAIHAGGADEAVNLHNQEHWELWNLEITNEGATRGEDRCGVRVTAEDLDGRLSHVHLRNLSVHDVNGVLEKGARTDGTGILFRNADGAESAFEDLLVEGCHLRRVDRNGIVWHSDWTGVNEWFPSRDVRVRNNLLENIGGDGIVPTGCAEPLVEHNTCRECRARAEDAAVAIWPWGCVDALFQFNEASHTHGTIDGQGFDADWNCRGTTFQYNYSHDNEGGFMLIVDAGGTGEWNRGNTDVDVRYNVSENDGHHTVRVGGPVEGVRVYNNVIYVPEDGYLPVVQEDPWRTWPNEVSFLNNVFYVDGTVRYDLHEGTDNTFENNCYAGSGGHVDWPGGESAMVADPRFVEPGTGTSGLDGADGYRLRANSPCLGAGRPVPEDGERGYWGNPLPDERPQGSTPIGAYAGEGVDAGDSSDRTHAFAGHVFGREYVIRNVGSGGVLKIEGDRTDAGAEVVAVQPADGGGADHWRIEDVGDDRYCFRNDRTGQFLDIADDPATRHSVAVQRPWHGGDTQRFGLVGTADGTYRIETTEDGILVAAPADAGNRDGQVIRQSDEDSDRQLWRIRPVEDGT